MLVIGITGATGSGKTALLERIAQRGGLAIDCDRLYYDLLRENAAMRREMEAAFGQVFLPDGQLDRKRLAAIVFPNEEKLSQLNQIVYRHMGGAVERLLADAKSAGTALAGVDAINLLESGLAARCDATVCVTAPDEVRLMRIMQRDGLSEEAARSRMRAQKSGAYYEAHCQYHIVNSGSTREEFSRRADALLNTIIKEHTL